MRVRVRVEIRVGVTVRLIAKFEDVFSFLLLSYLRRLVWLIAWGSSFFTRIGFDCISCIGLSHSLFSYYRLNLSVAVRAYVLSFRYRHFICLRPTS